MPVSTKPVKTPKRNSSDDPEEFRMSLVGHIDELRTRLIRIVLLILGCWIIGFFIQPWVFKVLTTFVDSAVRDFQATHPTFEYKEPFSNITDPFMTIFRLSFMLGLGLALPIIVLEIWGFVRPGLKIKEAKPITQLAPVSVLLFFMGVGCCWLILPTTFQWFLSFIDSFPGTVLYQQPGTMVYFTLKLMLAFGIGFQLPLVIYIAGRIGLVSAEMMTHYWRHATVFVFVTSAILTPSNDPITMLMMAVPLSVLVMLSIFAVRLTSKKTLDKARPPELDDLD